jgi:hypothetical protein
VPTQLAGEDEARAARERKAHGSLHGRESGGEVARIHQVIDHSYALGFVSARPAHVHANERHIRIVVAILELRRWRRTGTR